jgi:hypothetical protein
MTWDGADRKKARFKYYLRQVLINIGVIGILLYIDVFRFKPTYLYIYIGVMLVITLMQIFNARLNVKKQAEKTAVAAGNQNFFLEASVDISDAGIVSKNENVETRYRWKSFIKKDENKEYYFLFTSSIQAMIFPKRIFKTAEEKMQFEKLLSQHLSFDAEVGHLIKE